MAAGINPEAINTHLDEFAVAVDKITVGLGILGVEVHTVTGNLCPPAVGLVPVEIAVVVPQVVGVVVYTVGVLHLGEAVAVLSAATHAAIVVLKQSALRDGIGYHALAHVALRHVVVAVEQLAQMFLAKVSGVVDHNVEYHLHAAGVSCIDEVLELHIVAFETAVHMTHVHSVIAVIVISRCVLDNGRNPYRGEAQSLDIIEFIDKSFEVSAPFGVLIGNIAGLVSVPAISVVAVVAVIEACGHSKVDSLIAKIGATAHKVCRCFGYE